MLNFGRVRSEQSKIEARNWGVDEKIPQLFCWEELGSWKVSRDMFRTTIFSKKIPISHTLDSIFWGVVIFFGEIVALSMPHDNLQLFSSPHHKGWGFLVLPQLLNAHLIWQLMKLSQDPTVKIHYLLYCFNYKWHAP